MSTFGFGTDETEQFDTLAQAERLADGSIEIKVVQIDKLAPAVSPDNGKAEG